MREKERQTDLMQQHQQLQLQMYRELQKLYQQTCETAHDINRHITALQAWIAENPHGMGNNIFPICPRRRSNYSREFGIRMQF